MDYGPSNVVNFRGMQRCWLHPSTGGYTGRTVIHIVESSPATGRKITTHAMLASAVIKCKVVDLL
jgi:hypothetical protein